MTERGLPIVDGAPACPFVAFDEDRDERAPSPDHRHRCYAEIRPAPRALAHQEAYCLSSAFPVCPTFQDWARREAARARRDETPSAVAAEEDVRPARRDWTAPPPWVVDAPAADAGRAAATAAEDDDEEAEEPDVAPIPARGGGLSGSFADRLLGRDEAPAAASARQDAGAAAGAAAAGAAAGAGASLAEASRRGVAPGRAARPVDDELDEDAWDDEDAEDEDADDDEDDRRGRRRRGSAAGRDRSVVGAAVAGRSRRDDERWERPRRLDAYPTLRDRGMSGAQGRSRIILGFVAIVIAAVALFFLPTLLGIGSGPSATPSPSTPAAGSSVAPSAAAPTPTPGPTEQVYVVQAGDTMSRIAAKFHVPLQTLIDANSKTIPNPDALQIGDKVTIPTAAASSVPNAFTPAPTK